MAKRQPLTVIHRAINQVSLWVTFAFLAVLTVVMVVEALARYALGSPLGWNISLIENFLLPGIVFLGLPWARTMGAHVSAGMVYERLPARVQRVSRGLALGIEMACYLALLISGLAIAITMAEIGAVPPPLSSQLFVPSWVWRSFLPLGAGAALVLVLIELVTRREAVHLEHREPTQEAL